MAEVAGLTTMLPPKIAEMLGTTDFDSLKSQRKLEEEKWLEENVERLKTEYGVDENFSDFELLKLRDYEESTANCTTCKGLPCQKKVQKGEKLSIKVDTLKNRVYTYNGLCKFERARLNRERIKRNFKSANISADYLKKTFEDYKIDADNKKAVEVAKQILLGEESGAYFYGAFGAGKTFLSVIIANEFVKKGVNVLFYKVPFLLKDLQDAMFDKDHSRESRLLKQLCEVPVLILDDLGMSGKISTYAAGRLSMIIDARYENSKLATIITSNLSLSALQEKLDNPSDAADSYTLDGSRIVDRLKAMCVPVKFLGESRRSKISQSERNVEEWNR